MVSLSWTLMGLSSNPIKLHRAPIISLGEKLYMYCSVLVGSRNRFECDLQNRYCLFHNQTEINKYELKVNGARFLLLTWAMRRHSWSLHPGHSNSQHLLVDKVNSPLYWMCSGWDQENLQNLNWNKTFVWVCLQTHYKLCLWDYQKTLNTNKSSKLMFRRFKVLWMLTIKTHTEIINNNEKESESTCWLNFCCS